MVCAKSFFEEVSMFRIQAPILVVPTAEARQALGRRLRWAGLAAYREIAVAAKGLEIAHLQFVFFGLTLAVCSRVRRDGIVEIEIGLGDPNVPSRSFGPTDRQAEAAASRLRALRMYQKRARLTVWPMTLYCLAAARTGLRTDRIKSVRLPTLGRAGARCRTRG